MQVEGRISELLLLDGAPAARIHCPAGLIPAPGQYVLAHRAASDAPLAACLFAAGVVPGGFIAAPPISSTWTPGMQLHLRGPLGRGFSLPPLASRIALVSFKSSSRILFSLLEAAFSQAASVALVADQIPDDLPLQVEAHPLHTLQEISHWADYMALDIPRGSLPELKEIFQADRVSIKAEAEVLVRTPMPCGALATCGVCTIDIGGTQRLACEDGPVFDFRQLMGWSSRA